MAVAGTDSRAGDGRPVTGRVARRRSTFLIVALVLGAVATLVGGPSAQGQETTLGTAQRFAVLAASTITNTGSTTINGDVGLYPGTAVSGFGSVTQTGELHINDAVAQQGQIDARAAYVSLASRECTADLTGQRQTVGATPETALIPGVYCFSSSAQLTGTLYLTGGGPYVFIIGSTLITAPNSSVVVLDPTQQGGCDIFWAVGTSATLDTGTQFVGTIIAQASITANTGAVVNGRLIALTGAVTLQSNTINRPECGTTTTTTSGPATTTSTTAVPGTTTSTTAVPGTTIVVPGTTIVVPGTTTTTTTLPTTTTIPGTTTTTTLQPGGGGPGPGPTTTAAPATTTTGLAATTTTTAAPATTTTARVATTTTTVRPGTTGTTAPGGGTGPGAGEALALTGPTHLQPMLVAALLAVLLGAMMLMSSGPGVGGLLVAAGPQGQRRGDADPARGRDLQRDAGASQGVTPPAPAPGTAQVLAESDSRRRDISPAEATRSALRSAESISWTLRLPEA